MTDHSPTGIVLLEEDNRVRAARSHWRYYGQRRPDFAAQPERGQQSVWDFPRPPRMIWCDKEIRVEHRSRVVARSLRAVRVEETAGAPTYYLPPEDVDETLITYGDVASVCEWKGAAQTLSVRGVAGAGWRYVQMFPAFAELYLWPSFYPGKLDCFVGVEKVIAQPGGFYGGWVTKDLAGPIKGEPGSSAW
ncbi:MAG: DUF427 domain-containing protein [Pseudomonadaceae bacterium]|nr:DUF427 domain-containing protein [Pseudomonadaceae bacterium]